jgi:hypothetical protein
MELYIRNFNMVVNIPTTSEPMCTKFAFSQALTVSPCPSHMYIYISCFHHTLCNQFIIFMISNEIDIFHRSNSLSMKINLNPKVASKNFRQLTRSIISNQRIWYLIMSFATFFYCIIVSLFTCYIPIDLQCASFFLFHPSSTLL